MNDVVSNDYINDLNRIKETIRQNQNKAMIVVNSAMIMTYYEIGTIINKRKAWGSKYIQKLSEDLKEYGKGYSRDNLYRMSQFASKLTNNEIMEHPVPQIPWGTIIEIRLQPATKIPWFTIVIIMEKIQFPRRNVMVYQSNS